VLHRFHKKVAIEVVSQRWPSLQRPQRNRQLVRPPPVRDRVPLDWNGTLLKLPETEVNLIFLARGCLDKDTNTNEATAVSRITQNDQIGLLEPG
jgi:hypothetical protein